MKTSLELENGFTLREAIEAEGFEVKITTNLYDLRGGLGEYFDDMFARAYKIGDKPGVAIVEDNWGGAVVFSAAHEIAEYRKGFQHTAEMFCEQCNILTRWIETLAERKMYASLKRVKTRA